MNILEINSVKKQYSNFKLSIDFKIASGEFVALVGPNGAGKSTTIGIILNMIKKESGEILIFNKDHIKYEAKIKEKMGIVLEHQHNYQNIKINSIIKFCASLYPNWDWDYEKKLQNKLGLNENKKFKELSKGMKVKLALIIALSSQGELFVFDEPTTGLDPKIRHLILDEIKELKNEKRSTVLFSSNNMDDVVYLSDRIILLNNGLVVFDEKKEYLLNKWKMLEIKDKKDLDFSDVKDIFSIKKRDDALCIITNQYSDLLKQEIEKKAFQKANVNNLSLEDIFLLCTDENR